MNILAIFVFTVPSRPFGVTMVKALLPGGLEATQSEIFNSELAESSLLDPLLKSKGIAGCELSSKAMSNNIKRNASDQFSVFSQNTTYFQTVNEVLELFQFLFSRNHWKTRNRQSIHSVFRLDFDRSSTRVNQDSTENKLPECLIPKHWE
ncbi:hypothetical protein JTB14_013145 [Gonioctena quinquepunctata]|nr:hypothetical protein JTB14_013145 [Gonioctena quinquepunctata]